MNNPNCFGPFGVSGGARPLEGTKTTGADRTSGTHPSAAGKLKQTQDSCCSWPLGQQEGPLMTPEGGQQETGVPEKAPKRSRFSCLSLQTSPVTDESVRLNSIPKRKDQSSRGSIFRRKTSLGPSPEKRKVPTSGGKTGGVRAADRRSRLSRSMAAVRKSTWLARSSANGG